MEVSPMKSRMLTLAMVLVFLAMAAFIAGPAVSGEHPWDSDKDGGGRDGGDGGSYYEYDSVIVVYDTVYNNIAGGGIVKPITRWTSVWRAIWKALMM